MKFARHLIKAVLTNEFAPSYSLQLKHYAMEAEYEVDNAERALETLKNIEQEELTLP